MIKDIDFYYTNEVKHTFPYEHYWYYDNKGRLKRVDYSEWREFK